MNGAYSTVWLVANAALHHLAQPLFLSFFLSFSLALSLSLYLSLSTSLSHSLSLSLSRARSLSEEDGKGSR